MYESARAKAHMPGSGELCRRLRDDPSRLPLVLLGALLLSPALWAGDSTAAPGSPAGAVLARYTAKLERMSDPADCRTVAVEIEAALPKRAKRGRLLALRHSSQVGGPEYEVLQVEGDRTVRQQVIARYLSAQVQADSLAAASVAVTPANYKFRLSGSIATAGALTYVFQITPRRKRVGLMRGELWIDAATALAVHQAGHLVKSPSILLRRIDVTRDTSIRNGFPDLRVTHLDIDTRLVGHAELTIKERPCAPQSVWTIARVVPNTTAPVRENDSNACLITP